MANKNISISKIVPALEKLLKDGKTVQMEYNHQTNEIKVLENKIKRIKLNDWQADVIMIIYRRLKI